MKKSVITLAAVAVAALWAQARTLTPAEALGRAMRSADIPEAVASMRAPAIVKPAYTLNQLDSQEPALYVISCGEGEGCIVVSADDVAAPVLAYTDGYFDMNSAPENFKWWLSQYQAEISEAVAQGLPAYDEAAAAPSRANIAPKCTTKWDQDAPYWEKCPTVNGAHTYTGCVATAMAQVINYHKYPVKGTGTHSYTWNSRTLTFDYANTTFDWANMLDVYTSAATTVQKNAVATLMYACGVSVNMSYGTGSSGAVSQKVPAALRDNFGFDKAVHYEDRLVYTSSAWENLVYDQVDKCGPTYYSGRGESGGHAFVVDGYKDGFFHFNWGWSGVSDGYFRLNGLTPGTQGIGGNSDGFNTNQAIIADVRKPQPDSQLALPYVICTVPMDAKLSGTRINISGQFINYSTYSFSGGYRLEYRDKNTGAVVKVQTTSATTMDPLTYTQSITFSATAIPEGEYYAYLQVYTGDVVAPVHFSPWNPGGYIITKRNGTNITVEVPRGVLTTGEMTIVSPMYTNRLFAVDIPYTYTGTEDVLVAVIPQLRNAAGTTVCTGERFNAIVEPGQNKIQYTGTWLSSVSAGAYNLVMTSDAPVNSVNGTYSDILGGPQAVTLSQQSGATMMTVASGDWSIDNAENVDPYNLTVKAKVNCLMGYFAGAIIARIYENGQTSSYPITEIRSENVFISGGQKPEVTINGEMLGGVAGNTYQVLIYSSEGSKLSSQPKSFVLGNESGIESVVAGDANLPVEYFNLQGLPVARPEAGSVLIRRQGDKVEKIIVK